MNPFTRRNFIFASSGVAAGVSTVPGLLEAAEFIASAREAAGWAMLVKHPVNKKLYNIVSAPT